MTVVFFHQVLPLSLTAFLFQGRAITNFPFLLSLLSLMLICQHFFLWSLIVCPASVLLPLLWQLLQTRLLLCPSHTCLCVVLLVPLMFGMTILRSLLEGTCLSSGPEKQMKEKNHLEPMSSWACYQQIVLSLNPFPLYGTVWHYFILHLALSVCICTVKRDQIPKWTGTCNWVFSLSIWWVFFLH